MIGVLDDAIGFVGRCVFDNAHFANALAGIGKRLGNARDIGFGDDNDHAQTAIERAQHVVGRH